jgi:hypothetical protein
VNFTRMRSIATMFVVMHLVLRGIAVPHGHGLDEACPHQAAGVHIHLNWLSGDRGQQCEHSSRGAAADCDACRSPDHGGVVYLDDGLAFVPAEDKTASEDVVPDGHHASPINAFVAPDLTVPFPESARPAGDVADTLHRFLPHVLRI